MSNEIKDFGEKIGGAKKDIWKNRHFTIEDLDSMTEREAFKYCIKDTVWRKPDYVKLAKEKPAIVVYFIKKIRDSLPAKVKPDKKEEKNIENMRRYIEFISLVRDITMAITIESELTNLFGRIFVDNGFYNRAWTGKIYLYPFISNKCTKAIYIRSYDIEKAKKEIMETGFPEANKEDGWKKGISIRKLSDKYYIVKDKKKYYYEKLSGGFESYKDASEYLETQLKEELKNKKAALKLDRPVLKQVKRAGQNFRNSNVTTEDFLNVFKFRGGEFGNWASDTERQMHLNYAFDALLDMATVLNVAPEFLSLSSELGIAFGSRGSGNALAHYEPSRVVINLTKIRGAGCLAHEWGHAFDDYLGRLCDKDASNTTYASNSIIRKSDLDSNVEATFKNIIDAITKKTCSDEEKKKDAEKDIEKYIKNIESWLVDVRKTLKTKQETYRKVRRAATEKEIIKFESIVEDLKSCKFKNTDTLNTFYKEIKGNSIDKPIIEKIEANMYWLNYSNEKYKNPDNIRQRKISDFYKNAKEIDKTRKKPYWSTTVEMYARAFEAYIEDKIEESGNASQYLVHSTDNRYYMGYKPYPEGQERKDIGEAFDNFFNAFKKAYCISDFSYTSKIKKESHVDISVPADIFANNKYEQVRMAI